MSTCPIPCLESSSTPSHLPKPCMRKYRFQNKSFLFSKTHYRGSVKILDYPPSRIAEYRSETVMVLIRSDLLDDSPRQIFGKSSVEIPFTIMFHFCFISCHALTPNFLGCLGAHGKHYAISKLLMLIYLHAYININ